MNSTYTKNYLTIGWRVYMRKFRNLFITAILWAVVSPGITTAQEKQTENSNAKILRDLNEQLNGSLSIIQGVYNELNRLGLVDTRGYSIITMRNEEITPMGSSAKFIHVMKAKIQWSGDKIANITFDTSRGRSNSGYVLRSSFWMIRDSAHPEGDKSANLRLNVRETIESGQKSNTEYRFTDDYSMKQSREVLSVDGINAEFAIIPIFEVERKIQMTREYLSLVKDLELRTVIITGGGSSGLGSEIDGVLKFE